MRGAGSDSFSLFVLQSGWLSRQFRDCNGESNGIALPDSVLQEEKFCEGNSSEVVDNSVVDNSVVRLRMFLQDHSDPLSCFRPPVLQSQSTWAVSPGEKSLSRSSVNLLS